MKFHLGLLLALLPVAAFAQQGGVQESRPVTPGHPAKWVFDNVIGDGGGSASGLLSELGITNTGTPLGINDAPITAAGGYHSLVLGANTVIGGVSGGVISYDAHGAAQKLPLRICQNGTCLEFPFTQTGVLGSPPSQVSYVPIWGNTQSTLLLSGSPTGQFYASQGAAIDRMGDRVFIGQNSNVNNGNNPSGDWLDNLIPNSTSISQLSVLAQPPAIGGIAITAGARSSDCTNAHCDVFAISGFGYADNTAFNTLAWGGYFEGNRRPGAPSGAQAIAVEVDPVEWNDTAGSNRANPYFFPPNLTAGLWVASGGGRLGPVFPASVGLGIINNLSTVRTGILIEYNALTGATGLSGSGIGEAIAMGLSHQIDWYQPTTFEVGAFIRSDVSLANDQVGMVFGNQGTVQFSGTASLFVNLMAGGATGPSGGGGGGGGPFPPSATLNMFAPATGDAVIVMQGGGSSQTVYSIAASTAGVFEIFDSSSSAFPVVVNAGNLLLGATGRNVRMLNIPSSGSAVASLCVDGSGNIFRKTTTGACL